MSGDLWGAAIRVGGENRTLAELAEMWADYVLELIEQSIHSHGIPSSRRWGPDDLLAVWNARDLVAACLQSVEPSRDAPSILVALDTLYRMHTDEAGELVEATLGELLPEPRQDLPWWWCRIPLAGPVTDELRSWDQGRVERRRKR